MERKRHETKDSGGSLNGFFFGVVVGVAIALLFTTKKGRKILKMLTEEGMDKVTKWEGMLGEKIADKIEEIDEAAVEEGSDYLPPKEKEEIIEEDKDIHIPKLIKEPTTEKKEEQKKEESQKTEEPEKPTPKRFFRRSSGR